MLKHQRGTSLIEALIAFLVLSLGMLGMARLQNQLRLHADIARQRSEAVRLAQEDIESLRSFATLTAAPDGHSYADIASATRTFDAASGHRSNASYRLVRHIDDAGDDGMRTAAVALEWQDREGATQRVQLDSLIAAAPPALSGALTVQAMADPLHAVRGRSAAIPLAATDLGNGRSAWTPTAAGTVAVIFSNLTGQISARCNVASGSTQDAGLQLNDLGPCDPVEGWLLSGTVRFSLSSPPDPSRATDAAMPLAISLALDGASASAVPECISEVQERSVTYHCIVAPAQGRWSGHSSVVPRGWSLGTRAGEYKVCRYSADQDGSGAVDRNAEHPEHYHDVDGALMQQNFLIVKGSEPCPVAAPINTDGRGVQIYSNLGTVQHQP